MATARQGNSGGWWLVAGVLGRWRRDALPRCRPALVIAGSACPETGLSAVPGVQPLWSAGTAASGSLRLPRAATGCRRLDRHGRQLVRGPWYARRVAEPGLWPAVRRGPAAVRRHAAEGR